MGQSIPDLTGRRRAQRLRLAIEARLTTTFGDSRVRLENLSETGAHMTRPKEASTGQCLLRWLGFESFGEIVWLRGGYCGIRFDTPLPESWVMQTREHAPDVPEAWKLPTPSRVRRI